MPASGRGDTYGFLVVAIGLAVLLVMFLYAANRWDDAKDFVAAMGAVTGTVGTIIGAYFGVKVGERGKKEAEQARDEAVAEGRRTHEKLSRLAAASPPEIASRILESR